MSNLNPILRACPWAPEMQLAPGGKTGLLVRTLRSIKVAERRFQPARAPTTVADLYYIYQHEKIGVCRVVRELQELFRAGSVSLLPRHLMPGSSRCQAWTTNSPRTQAVYVEPSDRSRAIVLFSSLENRRRMN